eukprot:429300-Pyramimonas_sp.AAC.1
MKHVRSRTDGIPPGGRGPAWYGAGFTYGRQHRVHLKARAAGGTFKHSNMDAMDAMAEYGVRADAEMCSRRRGGKPF